MPKETPDLIGELVQAEQDAADALRSLSRLPSSTPDDDAGLWHITENGPRNPIIHPDYALDD